MSNKRSALVYALGQLASGSTLGYATTLALSPVLTRLYSPAEFGTFAIFGAFVALTSIFASGSLELGILGSRSLSVAALFGSSATSVSLICMVSLGFILSLCLFSEVPLLLPGWALYAAVLSCLIAVLTTIGINWAIRNDQPGVAARATFASLAGRSGLQAGFGVGFGGLEGLVLGELVGRCLGWAAAERGMLSLTSKMMRRAPRRILKHVARQKSYFLLLTPASVMEAALVWLPPSIFALLFDPVAGGLIALVQRFGSAPLTIANQSMAQLFHREASRVVGHRNGLIFKVLLGVIGVTFPVLVLLLWILWTWGDIIALNLLGPNWEKAGFVALVFLPLYYTQFLSLMTNRLILIWDKMHIKFGSSVLHLILFGVSVVLSKTLNLDWQTAICLMSAVLCTSHIIVFGGVLMMINDQVPVR